MAVNGSLEYLLKYFEHLLNKLFLGFALEFRSRQILIIIGLLIFYRILLLLLFS